MTLQTERGKKRPGAYWNRFYKNGIIMETGNIGSRPSLEQIVQRRDNNASRNSEHWSEPSIGPENRFSKTADKGPVLRRN